MTEPIKYEKEAIYDEQIAPLMKQIIEICKREELWFVSQFYLKQEREDAEHENQAMFCTTAIVPPKSDILADHHDHLTYVANAMKYGKAGKPWVMSAMITSH